METAPALIDGAFWITAGIILFLLVLSGFFSGSETAMMALNRYFEHLPPPEMELTWLKIRGFSYTRMGNLVEVLTEAERISPLLPVEQAAQDSQQAIRWFAEESPDWTQFGSTE